MGSYCRSDLDEDNADESRNSTGSEVILTNGSMATTAVSGVPNISNLNITKSSQVHIGPKLVSVTQNVVNQEGVKGQFLCFEVVSEKSKRRLRCSIAVFVCWALIVACGLAVYLFRVVLAKQSRLDIGLHEPWYLRRNNWQSMKLNYELVFRPIPVKQVIIGHSVTASCNDLTNCTKAMMDIQQEHLRRGYDDIGPNYLVGGSGFVFEGRGANVVGVMVAEKNTISVTIMFIGDYRRDQPNQAQFDHLNQFFDVLVKEKVLMPDYVVYGHCQVVTYILTPGPHIMENMHKLSHWDPVNATTCLRQ